jgi:YVTN family beta-propeller protein
MFVNQKIKSLLLGTVAVIALGNIARAGSVAAATADLIADGDAVTPTAVPHAVFQPLNPHLAGYESYTAGQAISTAVSPNGKTLLILTSGYNLLADSNGNNIPAASNEYVFVYDIADDVPVQTQVLEVPNTYVGIAFGPTSQTFYVSGGVNDDVHTYALSDGVWAESGSPIALGHAPIPNDPFSDGGVGIEAPPEVSSLAVTADGSRVVADNFYNDSISIITLAGDTIDEVQLRPGLINAADQGVPGGEYPFGIAIKGNDTAYVSSVRDREIDVVSLTGAPALKKRIPVPGNPLKMILNKAGTMLYVATDNADAVEVIDTKTNKIVGSIPTIAPPATLSMAEQYRGVDPNSLALSPDQKTLYVTNGGTNSLAVIDLTMAKPQVVGLIPTGDYPNAVSISKDGKYFYVVNGRSTPGPNPNYCSTNGYDTEQTDACEASHEYILQLSKAGFLNGPIPTGAALAKTTATVAADDHFGDMPSAADEATMAFLHKHIKHIIYIIRENRTYDQILGDLGEGNGDPSLAEFGAVITPNAHALATNFVDLDNFYDTGEVSGNGWPWSTSAHESDMSAKNLPVNYANRGLTYDWEGTNRNVDIAEPTLADREEEEPLYQVAFPTDPADVLPGTANIAAPDSPSGQYQKGYLWDAALRAGLTVRNYGFLEDLDRYEVPVQDGGIAEVEEPYATKYQVAFSANPTLLNRTDPYFRGFDTAFPDYWREQEWAREFLLQISKNDMPNLTLLRLMHDHLGSFSTAIDGVNTPETQIADNDYAVGKVIETVAHSPYASSTLIFVVEDDAQDGADHVDAHRSEAFIVGPYVKHNAIVSTRYSTVNFLRTIEDILGIDHLSIHDAYQVPMADVFDTKQATWTYTATVPAPLSATTLPIASQAAMNNVTHWHNAHPATYWAALTQGYNWTKEDQIPTDQFNRVLWNGLMPGRPYPVIRSGIDYDKTRATKSAALTPAGSAKAD